MDAGQYAKKGHSVEGSLHYILKYLAKSYGKGRQSTGFNYHRNELVRDGHVDNWDHGFRRISRSRDWPCAYTGDLDMFHYIDKEDEEVKQYSRRDRYRAYGRMMRAIRNEAITKTEVGWWDVIEEAADEELVKNAWKMLLRRKLALDNIREWRTKWMPIIEMQVMTTGYKNHGPNWKARGVEQGESFEEWWDPHFEVEGTLYKGIA